MPLIRPFSQPGRFWKGNLHTHSFNSDGTQSPEAVCAAYREAGYDFIALTDHFEAHYNWPITDTQPYRTPDFTTILGAEVHTMAMELGNVWHMVAVGLPLDFAPTQYEETGPQLAARALQAGAYVAAAHPQWHAMTENDMLALGDVHAVEIYNGSCAGDNDSAESSYMLDLMLMRGKRFTALATDDAHFIPSGRDRFLGWVHVKSESLEPDALLAALKNGDYYSSTGPAIYAIDVVPQEKVTVRCSPALHIFLMGRPPEAVHSTRDGITEAEFSLRDWRSPYCRVMVRDEANRKAWSNPIWFDTLTG
jgi:histidinol phosphatase-like PHP family hydrolase